MRTRADPAPVLVWLCPEPESGLQDCIAARLWEGLHVAANPDERERKRAADERDRVADERGRIAGERDRAADTRHDVADERDRIAADREDEMRRRLPDREAERGGFDRAARRRTGHFSPWLNGP